MSTTSRIARVRYRGSWWSPSTATRVRIYARSADAWAAFYRLKAEGYMVEVTHAERTPWRMVHPAPWSTGPDAERIRAAYYDAGVRL